MREPIILEADDGFHFFATRELAERYVEAIDIESGIYSAYDSEGSKLGLSPAPTGGGTIYSPAVPENRSAELVPKLRQFFSEVGVPNQLLLGLSFPGLVQLGVERFLKREPEVFSARLVRAIHRLLGRG